jgi:hypothetical protein
MKLKLFMLISALLASAACKEKGTATISAGNISFKSSELFPEGIEYDSIRKRFFVTSLTQGAVSMVDGAGKVKLFIKDRDLVSAIGIRANDSKGELYVCSSDPGVSEKTSPKTQKKLAGLGVYNAKTGAKIKFLDLGALAPGGNHFCNDIALAPNGDIFVTDSFSPIIYKISPDLTPSIYANNARFAATGFGLNGIVALGDGSLVTIVSGSGKLFKIDGKDGKKITEVKSPKTYANGDGLTLINATTLAIIQNADGKVNFVTTADNFTSITESSVFTHPEFMYPTTGVVVDGKLHVLNSKLGLLFGGKAAGVTKFDIITAQ